MDISFNPQGGESMSGLADGQITSACDWLRDGELIEMTLASVCRQAASAIAMRMRIISSIHFAHLLE
jgi:hypothetical protein